MFEYIKGSLITASPSKIILENHGIGYQIFIPINNYSQLPQIGQPLTLYISTIIREDSHKLYGFLNLEQRDLFECLIQISGIGPKAGLSIIGHLEINDLQFAVAQGNIQAICKIPGIGKKTAERLMIELRDKIPSLPLQPGSSSAASPSWSSEPLICDAISALIHLGYNPLQAQKALQKAITLTSTQSNLSELITTSLRCI